MYYVPAQEMPTKAWERSRHKLQCGTRQTEQMAIRLRVHGSDPSSGDGHAGDSGRAAAAQGSDGGTADAAATNAARLI